MNPADTARGGLAAQAPPPRACTDCRFYRAPNCGHPESVTFDPIQGNAFRSARERRTFRAGSCGPLGHQWEARPPAPSIAKGCAIMVLLALGALAIAGVALSLWP